MFKLFAFSIILCLFVEQTSSQCTVTCPDICYVNNQGVSSICELIIDEDKLTNAGLNPFPGTVELRLNLSEIVTKVSFVLLVQTSTLAINLVTGELHRIVNIQLNGAFVLESKLFRNFPNLQVLSLKKVIFSEFPVFRYNLKLVTLECVDNEVSSGATDLTVSFINGLDSLVSIKFVCSAKVVSGLVFTDLDALSKIEFDKVDFSGASSSTFGNLNKLVEVSLMNAKISNLELIPIEVRNTIVKLELTNNFINELNQNNFKGFGALTELILVNNKFTKLERTHFQETPLLDTLDLSRNQIKSIETTTFYATLNLKTVLLVDSLLKSLHYHVLAPLVELELFALDGNPLTCDCTLFWIALFHQKFGKSFETGTNAKCIAPVEELNKKVFLLDTYETCDHNYSCFCIGSGSNLGCEGEYECLLGVPATNAILNTIVPMVTTVPPNTSIDFVGLQISLIIGFLGVIIVFVLFTFVVVSICICCCCCNDNGTSKYYV